MDRTEPLPVVPFGEALSELLKRKSVSASELARRMGLKSRNSVFRVLTGEGGYQAQNAFLTTLRESGCLELTEREDTWLARSLEVSRIGVEAYRSRIQMYQMLFESGRRAVDYPVRIVWFGREEGVDLGEALSILSEGGYARVTLCGCCNKNLLNTMARKLICLPVESDVRIRHYVYTGGDEITQNLTAIQGMLFVPHYTALDICSAACSPERERVLRSSRVLVAYRSKDGEMNYVQLLLMDRDRMILTRLGGREEYDFLLAQMEEGLSNIRPIKSDFGDQTSPEDFILYTQNYAALEKDRNVFSIKQDIPINFIHPDLLIPSLVDGAAQDGFSGGEDLEPLLEALYGIHAGRFENFLKKKKPTHTIFSREAMESFAQSGETTDHFYAMRPYTPEERVAILAGLRRLMTENPGFQVYFFRPEYRAPEMEITFYEGKGVLMSKPYTDYDLEGGHEEALIAQPDFCRRFKDFYMEMLLSHFVCTQEETLSIMDELIGIAQNQL